MSRTYETRNIPATTHKVIDKTVCDICKRETKGSEWEESTWHNDETDITVELSYEHRTSYGCDCCGGQSEKIIVDLCPTCFKDKLLPWLRSQGAQIQVKEYDW
jgi:hypothetical protein